MVYFLIGVSLPLITFLFFELGNLFWSIPSAILPIFLGVHFSYYLEVNNEKLIVKNLFFLWVHKEYQKNQITDISICINYGTSEEGNDIITKSILINTGDKSKKYMMDYNERYYIDLFYKLERFNYANTILSNPIKTKKNTRTPNKKVHITFEKIKNKEYRIADNNKLTQNITTSISSFIIFFGVGSFLFIFMLIIGLFQGKEIQELYRLYSIINIIYIIPLLISLYYFFLYLIGGKKEIVFNRKENTVTYPTSNYNKKNVTIPFNNFKFHKLLEEGNNYSIITKDETKGNLNLGVFRLYSGKHSNDFYSYILWYMNNRLPLPPGDVFDIYRQIDNEERKNL